MGFSEIALDSREMDLIWSFWLMKLRPFEKLKKYQRYLKLECHFESIALFVITRDMVLEFPRIWN